MALRTISVQLDEALIEAVDERRGDIPRQRFIARALRHALERTAAPDVYPPVGARDQQASRTARERPVLLGKGDFTPRPKGQTGGRRR